MEAIKWQLGEVTPVKWQLEEVAQQNDRRANPTQWQLKEATLYKHGSYMS